MPLLAADGYTYLHQQTLPMTLPMIELFLDGRELLRHAGSLRQLRAKLICQQCERGGQPYVVEVLDRPVEGTVFVACPHRPQGGTVQMGGPLQIQPLLLALGWNLACTACGQPLRGDNDPGSVAFTVTCPCTKREYRFAVV